MQGLLVEDEPLIVRMISRLVRMAGAELVHAGDVASARPLVSSAAFVISDWNLPDGTGAEVVRLALDARVPVIVCTSSMDVPLDVGAEVVAKGDSRRLRDFIEEVRRL